MQNSEMSKKPKQPEWYLVDGVARVWDGETWLEHKWTEPKGWYEFQDEEYYWDGRGWYAKDDDDDDDDYDDDDDDDDDSPEEKVIEELLLSVFRIESELIAVQKAFEKNKAAGELLRDKMRKIKSKGQEVSSSINDEMNSITCLREWHWKYIERYEDLLLESRATFLEYEKLKNASGLFINSKKKKIFQYAIDLTLLGQACISTTEGVFEKTYSRLVPGPDIRNEALNLMSIRLAAASKARGD